MDMHLHGAGMPRLVGGAGFSGGTTGPGGSGSGFTTQFRVLPNALPSECMPADVDVVATFSHVQPQKLRCGGATLRPLASTEPQQSNSHTPSPEKEYFLLKSNSLRLRDHISPEANKKKMMPAVHLHSESMPLKLDNVDVASELDTRSGHA